MVGLLHAMAFMVLLLIGWVIWNNKPSPLPLLSSLLTFDFGELPFWRRRQTAKPTHYQPNQGGQFRKIWPFSTALAVKKRIWPFCKIPNFFGHFLNCHCKTKFSLNVLFFLYFLDGLHLMSLIQWFFLYHISGSSTVYCCFEVCRDDLALVVSRFYTDVSVSDSLLATICICCTPTVSEDCCTRLCDS